MNFLVVGAIEAPDADGLSSVAIYTVCAVGWASIVPITKMVSKYHLCINKLMNKQTKQNN